MIATLKDIAKVLVAKHQLKQRDAEIFVNAIVDTVLEGLQADRIVKIKGFGTFKLTAVRDRESVNVNTGERIIVNGHDKISFTPDAVMRDMVNKPFAQFDTVVISDEVKFDDIQDEAEEIVESVETVDVAETLEPEPAVAMDALTDVVEEEVEEMVPEIETKEQPVVEEKIAEEVPVAEDVEVAPVAEIDATPVIETDTTPVIETIEAAPKAETVVEEKAEDVMEEVVENDNVIEEEKVEEQEKIEEKKENAVEKGKKSPLLNEHGFIIESDDDDNDKEESNCKKVFILYAIVANILIAALAFVMGYLCCSNGWLKFGPERVPEQEPVEVVLDSTEIERMAKIDSIRNAAMGNVTKSDSTEAKPAANDPVSLAKLKEDDKPAEVKQTPAQKPAEAKPAETKKAAELQKPADAQKPTDAQKKQSNTAANVPNQSAYEKDARVRTGAYYIIGTQETVKVRAGQTLKSISKFYLGEGMECYIEVYNGGVKEVSEGQTLKIPKLQLKKKTAKQ